jgi:hypothetical protein
MIRAMRYSDGRRYWGILDKYVYVGIECRGDRFVRWPGRNMKSLQKANNGWCGNPENRTAEMTEAIQAHTMGYGIDRGGGTDGLWKVGMITVVVSDTMGEILDWGLGRPVEVDPMGPDLPEVVWQRQEKAVRLKVLLRAEEDRVVFRVLEQDEGWRRKAERGDMSMYRHRSRREGVEWQVWSSTCPEIKTQELFLRGTNKSRNDTEVSCRINGKDRAMEVVRVWVEVLKEWVGRVPWGEDMEERWWALGEIEAGVGEVKQEGDVYTFIG